MWGKPEHQVDVNPRIKQTNKMKKMCRVDPRTPQYMDGRLKGVFSKLETSRNMKK